MPSNWRGRVAAAGAVALVVCAIYGSAHNVAARQTGRPAPGATQESPVIGSGTLLPAVRNLDTSLAFYRDVVGLAFGGAPAPRPFAGNPGLLKLHDTPAGAQLRVATARVPGSSLGIELLEYKDLVRQPVQPRLQDPGAITVILQVRNLDLVLARLKSGGVTVVTPGGVPVTLDQRGGKSRAVLVRDPDGFFVEFVQPLSLPPTSAPADSNITGARLALTVDDTEPTMRFYRDLLGFRPDMAPSFASDKSFTDLTGMRGAQVRRSSAQVPGGDLVIEFLECKADRTAVRPRIQDPGATILNLKVRDTDATLKTLRDAGVPIVSAGAESVNTGTERLVIVRDPNGFFIALRAPSGPGR